MFKNMVLQNTNRLPSKSPESSFLIINFLQNWILSKPAICIFSSDVEESIYDLIFKFRKKSIIVKALKNAKTIDVRAEDVDVELKISFDR